MKTSAFGTTPVRPTAKDWLDWSQGFLSYTLGNNKCYPEGL